MKKRERITWVPANIDYTLKKGHDKNTLLGFKQIKVITMGLDDDGPRCFIITHESEMEFIWDQDLDDIFMNYRIKR
jgi:hypothetical protein